MKNIIFQRYDKQESDFIQVGLCVCKNNTDYNVYKLGILTLMSFRTSEYFDEILTKNIHFWLLINYMYMGK